MYFPQAVYYLLIDINYISFAPFKLKISCFKKFIIDEHFIISPNIKMRLTIPENLDNTALLWLVFT